MKINDALYPYPVLCSFNEDYINSNFKVEYSVVNKGFNSRELVAEFQLDNKKIEKMVEENIASFALHIECPRTSYRKLFVLSKNKKTIKIKIDPNITRHQLEVNGFVVLNEDIENYHNDSINKEFYGENFRIKKLEKGNPLAVFLTQIIDIKTDKNDFEDIPSIINVGESKDDLMTADIDDDIIIIKIPKDQYKQYVTLSNTIYSDIIMTSTILPSLIFILDFISNENNVDTSLTWYKIIKEKLSAKDIEIEDINKRYSSLELAQMILEDPLERALNKIEKEVEKEVI